MADIEGTQGIIIFKAFNGYIWGLLQCQLTPEFVFSGADTSPLPTGTRSVVHFASAGVTRVTSRHDRAVNQL